MSRRGGSPDRGRAGTAPTAPRTVQEWREMLGAVLGALDGPVPTAAAWKPPAALRTRVLTAARRDPFRLVRAEEGLWRPLDGSAAEVKELYIDAERGAGTRLVRVPAAADLVTLSASGASGTLSAFVVDGELVMGDVPLATGDFARLGGARAVVRTTRGCALLIIEAPGDDGDATEVAVLRMAPGASLPEHQHMAVEELLLLHGDCLCQGVRLRRGDYHRAGVASRHGVTTTDGGCSMVLVTRPARPAAR